MVSFRPVSDVFIVSILGVFIFIAVHKVVITTDLQRARSEHCVFTVMCIIGFPLQSSRSSQNVVGGSSFLRPSCCVWEDKPYKSTVRTFCGPFPSPAATHTHTHRACTHAYISTVYVQCIQGEKKTMKRD